VTWTEFFTIRLPHIYFIYGLAFFSLGFAVALEIGRSKPIGFGQAMWLLAFFGFVHGSHEWITMFALIGQAMYGFQPGPGFEIFRLILLAISFALLIVFGTELLRPFKRLKFLHIVLPVGLMALYGAGLVWLTYWLNEQPEAWFAAADTLTRYTLAIPGALLAGLGLLAQRRLLVSISRPEYARDLMAMPIAFLVYGLIGQSFVNASLLFPAHIINVNTFQAPGGFSRPTVQSDCGCFFGRFYSEKLTHL
jgi:hypothetical protein